MSMERRLGALESRSSLTAKDVGQLPWPELARELASYPVEEFGGDMSAAERDLLLETIRKYVPGYGFETANQKLMKGDTT